MNTIGRDQVELGDGQFRPADLLLRTVRAGTRRRPGVMRHGSAPSWTSGTVTVERRDGPLVRHVLHPRPEPDRQQHRAALAAQ